MATHINTMIDIHTHILPGVDDGAKDMSMAIEMLRDAIKTGVTDIILTPHYYKQDPKKDVLIKETFKALQNEVLNNAMPIKLYLGREVYFKESLLEIAKELTIEQTPYILVEFSTRIEQSIEETIFNLGVLKLKPIVAHIERYPYLKKADYISIKKTGGLIQVNAESLIGFEGFRKRKLMKFLFKEKLVDIVASDCHNTTTRKPNLDKAYQKVFKKYGKAYADKLFLEGPKKIIDMVIN